MSNRKNTETQFSFFLFKGMLLAIILAIISFIGVLLGHNKSSEAVMYLIVIFFVLGIARNIILLRHSKKTST